MEKRITLAEREAISGHKALVFWLTGLSASGKSTLAYLAEAELMKQGFHCFVLDGDEMRSGLSRDLSFSPEGRTENIRRAGQVAKLLVEAGLIVITSFISPYRTDRSQVRGLFPPGRFFEVFLDCPPEICEGRDPKGLYQKARAGIISEFTGVSAPYEAPMSPDLVLRTGEWEISKCLKTFLDFSLERSKLDLDGRKV